MNAMSDPLREPTNAMTANSRAWTDPANWDGDEYVGEGLPPWGLRNRCPAIRMGKRCRKAVIPGGTICNTHGGAAPQVRKKAALRLAALVEPAIGTLAREMVNAPSSGDRIRAANSILDRAGVVRQADTSGDVARAILLERLTALREALAPKPEDEDDDVLYLESEPDAQAS